MWSIVTILPMILQISRKSFLQSYKIIFILYTDMM